MSEPSELSVMNVEDVESLAVAVQVYVKSPAVEGVTVNGND